MPECRLCGAANERVWLPQPLASWYRCAGCGLFFVHPQPDDDALGRLYQSAYYDRPVTDDPAALARRERVWGERLSALERVVSGRRLLDVGCGTGLFLACAARRGWAVHGQERDASALRAWPADQVFIGPLDDLPVAPEGCAAVTLFDVIEHVRDPLAFLRLARRHLAPGGALVLTTPNLGTLKHRLLGRRCKYFAFERYLHFFHFVPATLERLLRAAGCARVHWFERRGMPLFVAAFTDEDTHQ